MRSRGRKRTVRPKKRWHGICKTRFGTLWAEVRIPRGVHGRRVVFDVRTHSFTIDLLDQQPHRFTHMEAPLALATMKMITAIIRPFKLGDLELAVAHLGVQGMTVTESLGYGTERGHREYYRGADYLIDFAPRTHVQIAVDDAIVEPVVDAIANVSRTGRIGDGKIFVTDIEQAVRIRTGETGVSAT